VFVLFCEEQEANSRYVLIFVKIVRIHLWYLYETNPADKTRALIWPRRPFFSAVQSGARTARIVSVLFFLQKKTFELLSCYFARKLSVFTKINPQSRFFKRAGMRQWAKIGPSVSFPFLCFYLFFSNRRSFQIHIKSLKNHKNTKPVLLSFL
jgi:hypothetical protein